MSTATDWADDLAAQIILELYTRATPNLKHELLAARLRLIKTYGEEKGLREGLTIMQRTAS